MLYKWWSGGIAQGEGEGSDDGVALTKDDLPVLCACLYERTGCKRRKMRG